MLYNIPLHFIILPIIVIFLLVSVGLNQRNKKLGKSSTEKSVESFKLSLLFIGVISVVFYLCLPNIPVLSSFGYPESYENINSNEKLLKLLQDYNKAIVRTTEVLQWFLFLFIIWFVAPLFALITTYMKENK